MSFSFNINANGIGGALKKIGGLIPKTKDSATTTTQPVVHPTTTNKSNTYVEPPPPPVVKSTTTYQPVQTSTTSPPHPGKSVSVSYSVPPPPGKANVSNNQVPPPPVKTSTSGVPPPPVTTSSVSSYGVPPPPGKANVSSNQVPPPPGKTSTVPTAPKSVRSTFVPVSFPTDEQPPVALQERIYYPESEPVSSFPVGSLQYYNALCGTFPIIESGPRFGDELKNRTGSRKHYTSTGSSKLTLTIPHDFVAKSSQSTCGSKKGHFWNYFIIPVNIGSEEKIFLEDVKIHYKNHGGEWIPLADVKTGSGDYWYNDFQHIKIRPRYVNTFFFRGVLEIQGTAENRRDAQAHSSLPQPLTLKLTIMDSNNEAKEICIDQLNTDSAHGIDITDELLFPTRKYMSINGELVTKSVYCDDLPRMWKEYLTAVVEKDVRGVKRLVIMNGAIGKKQDSIDRVLLLDKDDIAKLELEASQKKVENISKAELNKYDIDMLFDKDTGFKLYGMKMKVKSHSGRVEKVVLVRDIIEVLLGKATLDEE